jgi:phosphatidylserine decarboxylase
MQVLNKILVSKKFQKLVNKNKISRFFGWLAGKEIPHFILKSIINKFIKSYHIKIEDFNFDIHKVKTFNQFFSRQFKPGVRSFGSGIASPVEGFLAAYGTIDQGMMFQVKGNNYFLSELTGNDEFSSNCTSFCTIYLSPADYHRVHAPFDLKITSLKYIPGDLFSTSRGTLESQKNVYCRNERIVLKGNCEHGFFFLILVGAIVVGKIKLKFDTIETNQKKSATNKNFVPPIQLRKGEELGWFEMGSTVILSLGNNLLSTINQEFHSKILLGETLCI